VRRAIATAFLLSFLVAFAALPAVANGCNRLPFPIGLVRAADPFPAADPAVVGLDPDVLDALVGIVRSYVETDEIVGAELLIIKDRRTVLHRAYGWRDREAESPMTVDTIFNIRSMTKPLTGLAVNLLIEDGLLALDDRAATYIDGFVSAWARRITIEQLLTHRSGLPLSILTETTDFPSLRDMAEAIGRRGPEFLPGSRFHYSDAGTDVLGAVIERMTGQSLQALITERLLAPLGMDDSFYYVTATRGDPRIGRIGTLYFTQGMGWSKLWAPDEPLYPFAWGSQTLYSTPRDYARILALLLDSGRWQGTRIADPETIAGMLRPVSPMRTLGGGIRFPTGFFELEAYYGQMAVLHAHVDDPEHSPVVIGHTGSDGTYAWAWPDHDLMVLFFTQSRGSSIGIALEAEIDRLLLHPEIDGLNEAASETYAGLLGCYIAEDDPAGRNSAEIIVRNGRLAMDVPWQIAYALTPTTIPLQWNVDLLPQTQLRFSLDSAGRASGFRLLHPGGSNSFARGTPARIVRLEPEDVEDLLGRYEHDNAGGEIEVVLVGGILALDVPDSMVLLELVPPSQDGWWILALNPDVAVRFDRDASGLVISLTARTPEGQDVHPRVTTSATQDDSEE